MENEKKQFSILDICEAVGATKRTLYEGFRELYRVTPNAYLKYICLNNVRRELLGADLSTTVPDVVYKWKFYHLSRFAKSYDKMFGEYPSEALRRCVNFNYST